MVPGQRGGRGRGHSVAGGVGGQRCVKGVDSVGDDVVSLRRGLCQLGVSMGMRAGGGGLMVQGTGQGAIGRVHVMSAGLLRLRLGAALSHLGSERIHGRSGLAGPCSRLGHERRRAGSGAWATGVKGRCAAMETATVTTASNATVAQVNWEGLLIMIVRSAAAVSTVSAAHSAGGRQGTGSLYGTAGLLKS